MSRRRFSSAPLAVCGVVAAGLVLAACGGSGSTTTASTASAEKTREQKFIEFAKCLREHGVNIPTPTGGGPPRIRELRGNRQAFELARTACKKYVPKLGDINLSPAERIARQEQVRKFAKCMREHGVPLEVEASSGGPGLGIRVHLGSGAPNRETPAFESARKACSGILPKRPGVGRDFSGPGGGAPPGGGPAGGASGSGGGGGAAAPAVAAPAGAGAQAG